LPCSSLNTHGQVVTTKITLLPAEMEAKPGVKAKLLVCIPRLTTKVFVCTVVYCYVYQWKDRKVNILILSDISFFCTYTLVATKRAHWRPWQIQQVCKESKDNLTCKQLYIMSVKLNKFSRRRIQRYCAGPRKS